MIKKTYKIYIVFMCKVLYTYFCKVFNNFPLNMQCFLLLTHCTIIVTYKSGHQHLNLFSFSYIKVKGHSLDEVTGWRELALTLNPATSMANILLISVFFSASSFHVHLFFLLSSRKIQYVHLWLGAFSLDSYTNVVRSLQELSRCLCKTLAYKNCMQQPNNNSCSTSSY